MNSLETLLNYPIEDIERIIRERRNVFSAIQGAIAEDVVLNTVANIAGVESAQIIPDGDSRPGDIEFTFNGRKMTIECKSVSQDISIENGISKGRSKLRYSHGIRPVLLSTGLMRTNLLAKSGPDAATLYAFNFSRMTGNYEFVYALTTQLPSSKHHPELLQETITIYKENDPRGIFTEDLEGLIKLA